MQEFLENKKECPVPDCPMPQNGPSPHRGLQSEPLKSHDHGGTHSAQQDHSTFRGTGQIIWGSLPVFNMESKEANVEEKL